MDGFLIHFSHISELFLLRFEDITVFGFLTKYECLFIDIIFYFFSCLILFFSFVAV